MRLLTLLFVLLAGMAAADETKTFLLSEDAYLAGETVVFEDEGRDDLFVAGERVTLAAPASGTAHVVGRWVDTRAALGGSLYAAGQTVDVEGEVAGDATIFAQEIEVKAPIGGDLRVFASEVEVEAPVGGVLQIAAEFVEWDGPVGGDMAIAVREISFGPDARIDGTLIVFEEDPGALEIPESVAPADRVTRRQIEDWDRQYGVGMDDIVPVSRRGLIGGFLMGVLFVTVVAAVVAALAPEMMATLRQSVLQRPGRAVLAGFVGQSVLIGGGILMAMTLIGLFLLPAAILAVILAGFAGYIVGAYALGVGVLRATGRHDPENTADRALAAGVGALAAGIIGLIPILGWIFFLVLMLAGIGACVLRLFRPQFFVDEAV
ncbi:MAG: hypothetical protein QNJ09_11725 [Paracoccaceae bacterium]|nr:hypothetical protein [Paracoccaceae bacterium]